MRNENIEIVEALVLENWSIFERVDANAKYVGQPQAIDIATAAVAESPANATVFDIVDKEDLESGWHSSNVFHLYFVERIASLRMNVQEVAASSANLLNEPPADAGWEGRYKNFLAQYIAQNGTPQTWGDGYYGWEDYDFIKNNKSAYIVAVLEVKTDRWDQFEDTFSGSSHHTGVVGYCVYSDGSQRRVRWEGEMSDLMKSIP